MTDLFAAEDGATPLMAEERSGLIPADIGLRRELNAAEQLNIARAHARLFGRRKTLAPEAVIAEAHMKRVHRAMFGEVWRWAGKYRRSDKNIGIDWHEVPTAMHAFLGDAAAWLQHVTYPPDELAIRLHHRLVAIHPFPNGNGRHARTMADLLILSLGFERFTWGGTDLRDADAVRRRYINALQQADAHIIEPLIAFART